jgi:sulfur-oxidizing protein SoxY
MSPLRRRDLMAASGLLLLAVRPARALEPPLEAAIRAWAGNATPRADRVMLEVASLIDNGNAVPVRVRVDSPMTEADHVREIALFNERNPQRDLVRFHLNPANGRAEAATRVRLATSQHLVALARMSDGSVWQHTVEVVVTLAACIED